MGLRQIQRRGPQLRLALCFCLAQALLPGMGGSASVLAEAGGVTLDVVDGNVFVVDGSGRRQITRSERDGDPVLTPDGRFIYFTRTSPNSAERGPADAACPEPADELRRVALDGSGDTLVTRGRRGDTPEQMLCEFQRKQFDSGAHTLFFLSPAWATSHALHALDLATGTVRYLMPANDLLVLAACTTPSSRDYLAVQQHRYLVYGGSYDWFWLFDPSGKREVGPIGDAESVEVVRQLIEDSGTCH